MANHWRESEKDPSRDHFRNGRCVIYELSVRRLQVTLNLLITPDTGFLATDLLCSDIPFPISCRSFS